MEDFRVISIGEHAPKHTFPSNEVKTTRYNLLNFIPKSLLWQFKRAANIYFLIISILTTTPYSPKNPYSMGATFAAVLIATMIKEGYEDYFRWLQDVEVNSAKVHIYDTSTANVQDSKARELQVGDIIQVLQDETIPADIVLLASSDIKGISYVNTMNLDGEVHLKEKIAYSKSQKKFQVSLKNLSTVTGQVQCDKPNPSLVKWNCNIHIDGEEWNSLTLNQLILKGCLLKNTDFIFGVVIYTGHESKIMLNSKKPPSKMSYIQKKMNYLLYSLFGFQAFICLLWAGFSFNWRNDEALDHDYLDFNSEPGAESYFTYCITFWVAYSHLIPISLYVSLEIVKLILAWLISNDLDMYYEPEDKRARCRTSDLIEELGQIEFIFSDKTGTLTCNMMEFRQCFVGGVVYDTLNENQHKLTKEMVLSNPDLTEFFLCSAICHSVFAAYNPEKPEEPNYQAASPDELALVQASNNLGITFLEKNDEFIKLSCELEYLRSWIPLVEIPFTSDRKRMTMIVKNPVDDQYTIYTKGADSIMLELISTYPHHSKTQLIHQLYDFATQGLRILVMAKKQIQPQEFEQWYEGWKKIQLSNDPDKDAKLNECASLLEKDMVYLGASAIEDKLQDQVPETIEKLIKANIKVWVLTGDKQETAIEIGKSCKMFTSGMELVLSSDSEAELKQKLKEHIDEFGLETKNHKEVFHMIQPSSSKFALIIDGHTLSWIFDMNDHELQDWFFKLGLLATSCICCRVSPGQKASVISLAHRYGKWITLAIGDGANDVSMIQTARIGVGIAGKEGTQAVQASDFSIAQFKFLQKLILVHGRWGYRRISYFICYYFYKNIAVVFVEIWFAIANGFSGQIFFMDWLPMLYNALWTSWPCMATYIFEQDISRETCLRYPNSYGAGQVNAYFTFSVFWKWLLLAIWHGSLAFWVPILGLTDPMDDTGLNSGLFLISTISFTLIIFIVTLKLLNESLYWSYLNM